MLDDSERKAVISSDDCEESLKLLRQTAIDFVRWDNKFDINLENYTMVQALHHGVFLNSVIQPPILSSNPNILENDMAVENASF